GRSAAPPRGRPQQSGDRHAASHQRQHGGESRPEHPHEDRRRESHAGGDVRRSAPARLTRRSHQRAPIVRSDYRAGAQRKVRTGHDARARSSYVASSERSGRLLGKKEGVSMTNLAEIPDLKGTISGEVVLPDDAGHVEARAVYNAMIDRRPALIARCHTPADVTAALEAGRRAGVPIAVRGGGHSGPGFGAVDG